MLGVGSVVDGKYKILNEIGHGGMSVVYLAINERANKTWAIKEVRKDGGNDSQVVQQGLVAETEMLKKLHHPHLPSIIDVIDKNDTFLIVMDYIEGRSLESVLKHGGPQEPEKVIEWSKQLCDVLGYLHHRQPPIIYRDMKPANVMLKPDGTVTLIDFGTAREYKAGREGDTTYLGTRGYAAPEQFGGRGQTDARTDIYCLGATMYHLLTGYSPADTNFEVLPLSQLDPSFAGSGLEKVVAKCCQANPQNRYQSCDELMYALEHVHDEDDQVVHRRNLHWASFVACLVLLGVSLVSMVGFKAAASSATSQSYGYYVEQAERADEISAAQNYYQSAMTLQPASAEAYESLLDRVERDLVFSQEEYAVVSHCINENDGSNRTNIDYLESEDRQAYTDFVYRLANDIYFFYEGSDKRSKAAEWYGDILDSEYLSPQRSKLTKALYTIGKYYDQLFSSSNGFLVTSNEYSFLTLWTNMVEITEGNVAEKTGGDQYAAGLYQEMVNQIYNNTLEFKRAGVTQQEMEDKLDEVETALYGLSPESDTVSQQIEATRFLISSARRMVRETYVGVGA